MTCHSIRDKFTDCLSQQISEFELLKSMYPNSGEIILTDSKVLGNINDFLDNKTDYTPNHLDFTLNLHVNNLKLEVCINLPTFYPEEEPDIYIRCNQLNRHQETCLNTELSNFIKNEYSGDVCLYTAITWLQENIDQFINKPEIAEDKNLNTEHSKNYIRQWIYSHHIYNKKKREEIIKRAVDLNLTGFCLPGKPGIVCIEGPDADCNEYWKYIKSMSWKKITIRKTETFELTEKDENQKFLKFCELHFQSASTSRYGHTDMARFSKFLKKLGLTEGFAAVLALDEG